MTHRNPSVIISANPIKKEKLSIAKEKKKKDNLREGKHQWKLKCQTLPSSFLMKHKKNCITWNQRIFSILRLFIKNKKKVTLNAYEFKRHHSAFIHASYLYFTGPHFNLNIFQVKETDVYRTCIISQGFSLCSKYMLQEGDRIYDPQICCYFNATVTPQQ